MNLKALKSLWQQALSCRPALSDWPIFLQGAVIALLFGRLFYDSWLAVMILLPLILPWFVHEKTLQNQRNRRLMGIQFRDAIGSVLTSMKAGYSVENAFIAAYHDMALLYGKSSLICNALAGIRKGLSNNIPIEKLLHAVGKKSGNRDILDFAEVFTVAKRGGGNMTEIIGRTIAVISRKMDVEKEIDVLISAKRMEAGIMNLVPFFIILYISITSKGFFEPLYHNLPGIILMTVCIGLYIGAYLMSERIVNIDV
ncbi:MAG: type II secretion system protein F [Butyrivibrio sp.]|nr:type II secretion system protein F [Butyrivibrio sp.]